MKKNSYYPWDGRKFSKDKNKELKAWYDGLSEKDISNVWNLISVNSESAVDEAIDYYKNPY